MGVTLVPNIVKVVPHVSCSFATNDAVMIPAFPTYHVNNGANEPVSDVSIGF